MGQKNLLFFIVGVIFSFGAFFLSFNSAQAAPSVTLSYPLGGECFNRGSNIPISFSYNTEVNHVGIYYSYNGMPENKVSIGHPVSSSPFNYVAPSTDTTSGKIWIEGHDSTHNFLIAQSSGFFSIMMSCPTPNQDIIPPTSPTVSASPYSSSSITISWSGATDNVGVAGYKIYRNSVYLNYTTGLSYTDSSLTPLTSYNYYVVAYDSAGNMSPNSNTATATTLSSGTVSTDTTAPVISGVATQNVIGSGAQIIWTTDDASTSKVWYSSTPSSYIFSSENRCDGGGYVTSHCVNLMDLVLSTTYYFKVESSNSNNYNTQSTGQQFTSASSAGYTNTTTSTTSSDTTAPTSPTVSASPYSSSSITISWSGATDNVGVAGYKIYRNSVYLNYTAGLSYTDTGLLPSTSYSYYVVAYDSAGNMSPQSVSVSATTYSGDTVLTNYAKLSGQVTNSSGSAVSGANVYVYSTTNNYLAYTDTNGNYSISGIYPGTYSVYVYQSSNSSYQHLSSLMSLINNQSAVLNFQFKDSAKIIRGKVSYSDGTAVTDAKVSAYNSYRGLWMEGSTDTFGNYQIKVSGGKWQLSVYKNYSTGNYSSNWSYTELPRDVVFLENDSIEESIVNFIVQSSSVSVKGKVVKPDGSAPVSGTVSIILKDSSGYAYSSSVDSIGSFSVSLPAGVYTGQVFSSDSAFGAVDIPTFSVYSGAYDLGQIYLISNAEKIKGKVIVSNGAGISGIWVNANEYQKNQFFQTKTLTDGSYELIISSGQWDVYAYADSSLGYISNQPSAKTTLAKGAVAEVNFVFDSTDVQINGNIIDENGQIVVDANGSISAYQGAVSSASSSNYYSFGGSIVNGSFSFKAAAGTYVLKVYLPSDSKYTSPDSQTITVVKNESKKVNFSIIKNSSSVTGFIRDNSGNIITGLGNDKLKIYFSSRGGVWYNAQIDSLKGVYNVSLAPGTWYMGYWVDQSSGYNSLPQDIEVILFQGQTKNVDIVLNKSDSYIAGVTKNFDGNLLANVWISVESKSFSSAAGATSAAENYNSSVFVAGINSDINGAFKVAVPAGVYYVHAYYPSSFGYINPDESKIEVKSGQTSNISMIFKNPEVKINGYTIIDGKKSAAFVWAWEDLGGYVQTRSDDNGFYSLNVSKNSKWHISASSDISGVYYKTSQLDISIGIQDASHDLILLPVISTVKVVEKTTEAVKSQSVELSDGAKIILPANSASTSGNINVSLKPSVEAPSFGNSSVVGSSYDVEVRDLTGKTITNLNSEIIVSLPYDDKELAGRGVKPEDLSLSFFDETVNIWKPLEKQIVDKTNKVVSGTVNHLTKFVLVSPADVLPPSAPTNIKANKIEGGIILSWINPTSDFHSVKIYKSEKKNELGSVAYNYINTTNQTDKISDNKIYYYTIRSVDLSGNESVNMTQISSSSVSIGVESISNFTQKLFFGSKGDEVIKLQDLLNKIGYNTGKADGKFGKMTKKALKQFQTANGLKADGIVGPKTRQKLNEVLSSSGISFCPQPLKYYGDLNLTNFDKLFDGLPSDYIPAELTQISSMVKASKSICLTSSAVQSLEEMFLAAQNDGLELMVNSGYRNFNYQKEIYDSWLKNNNATDSDTVARPGYSEHQLGTTVDLTGKDIKFKPTNSFFGDSAEGKWLKDNAYKYGFVLSYPDGKLKVTGYKYEPWHYRFVGQKIALEIVKNGLTPVEYFKTFGKFVIKQ